LFASIILVHVCGLADPIAELLIVQFATGACGMTFAWISPRPLLDELNPLVMRQSFTRLWTVEVVMPSVCGANVASLAFIVEGPPPPAVSDVPSEHLAPGAEATIATVEAAPTAASTRPTIDSMPRAVSVYGSSDDPPGSTPGIHPRGDRLTKGASAVFRHAVADKAANSAHWVTTNVTGALAAYPPIEAPLAGYTSRGFAPSLHTLILFADRAVGRTTPVPAATDVTSLMVLGSAAAVPWFDPAADTVDTVPLPPAGTAQVPSPRQKVEAEAPCPPFRFWTGRLPATSAPRFTG
jgi:hypothetical protein